MAGIVFWLAIFTLGFQSGGTVPVQNTPLIHQLNGSRDLANLARASLKRSVQPKSENIVFPGDEPLSSTRQPQRPPGSNTYRLPNSTKLTDSPNSVLFYPGAPASATREKPPKPESTSSSSEEGDKDEDSDNAVIPTQVTKFITWVKAKGLPENYTEPFANIDDIDIDNFHLGRVQTLKCPEGQVYVRGQCVTSSDF